MSFDQPSRILCYIIGVFCGLFSLPCVDTTVRFTRFPPNVSYVSSGGTARFEWDYHVDNRLNEFTGASPQWFFINQSTHTDSKIGYDDLYKSWSFVIDRARCPPRLQNPDRVTREPKATLVITDVTTADNGIYQCVLSLVAGNPIRNQVRLVVAVRPTFLQNDPNNTYNIIEGQDLRINCKAIGPPSPNITWLNVTDGNAVIKSQGSGSAVLQIDNIRRYHAGVYECQAKNNPNEDATTTRTRVTVYYKPTIRRFISAKKQHSWNGKMTTLRCIVDGTPQPDVTWYKPNGQQISCGVKAVSDGSQVTIRTTECGADYGLYKCQAVNVGGRDEYNIRVSQLFPPGPLNVTILDPDIQASSVHVRWTKPGYDGGSPVIDYKVQINTDPLQEKTTPYLHTYFFGLTRNTTYQIKVEAKTVVGFGNLSLVAITTKPRGKPAIPEIVAAVLHSRDSKLSVVLKWTQPDDNGGAIEKYSIYRKDVQSHISWKKVADITNPSQLQYTSTDNIVYGKSYMFLVTVWNKYGESAKDDSGAKNVNTAADRAVSESGTSSEVGQIKKSKYDTVVGVVSSLFVIALVLDILLFVILWRRTKRSGNHAGGSTTRTKAEEQSQETNIEMRDNTLVQVTQPAPEYEAIPGTTPFPSSGDASQYQELNILPSASQPEGLGPTYEPLRKNSKDLKSTTQQHAIDQHPYEPLDLKNKNSDYQSLQTINI